MTTEADDAHWIEVVDGEGLYPIKRLGPYASARQAERAARGVLRLLNAQRHTVAVVSQQDLEARLQAADLWDRRQLDFAAMVGQQTAR